jgi:hypothetical protein
VSLRKENKKGDDPYFAYAMVDINKSESARRFGTGTCFEAPSRVKGRFPKVMIGVMPG